MLWLSFKRVFRLGLVNFWRNGLVSLASLAVMIITLFVLGSVILSRAFLLASLDELKNQVDISVAFRDTASEADVLALKERVSLLPGVLAVTYRSREEELADFRERNKNNSLLLQSLEEVTNPFGARLNIAAAEPTQYEGIVKFLTDQDEAAAGSGAGLIYDISFKKDVVDKLARFITTAERAGLAVVIVLALSSIIVTFATVSLAIYVSREEISVMRLVGAENSYIRGPFLVEGLILGFLAAVVALALLYPAAVWLRGLTARMAVPLDLLGYFSSNFWQIFLTLLGSGVVLGVISSFLALRKHLKV